MISVDNFSNGIILTVLGLFVAFALLVFLAFSIFVFSRIIVLGNRVTQYLSGLNRSKDEVQRNKSLAAAVAVTILKNDRSNRSDDSGK